MEPGSQLPAPLLHSESIGNVPATSQAAWLVSPNQKAQAFLRHMSLNPAYRKIAYRCRCFTAFRVTNTDLASIAIVCSDAVALLAKTAALIAGLSPWGCTARWVSRRRACCSAHMHDDRGARSWLDPPCKRRCRKSALQSTECCVSRTARRFDCVAQCIRR